MTELDDEKKFYERFNSLHRDPDLVRVVARFGIEALRRSSALEGFEDFVKATGFRGRRCVEIGTCKGITAIILARYFEEVVTIDVKPDPQRHDIALFLGVENVQSWHVEDNAKKAEVISRLDFDAAFVDGDHANDTESDFALVKRCGCVLFHEYWQAQPPVWALVNRLRESGDPVETRGKFALWRSAPIRNH